MPSYSPQTVPLPGRHWDGVKGRIPTARGSLTRCPASTAKLRFITSQRGTKKQASMLYGVANEREKEDFSCPAKSLLPSEHVLVINICNLRLRYQAVKYRFNLGVSVRNAVAKGERGKEGEGNEHSLKELHQSLPHGHFCSKHLEDGHLHMSPAPALC